MSSSEYHNTVGDKFFAVALLCAPKPPLLYGNDVVTYEPFDRLVKRIAAVQVLRRIRRHDVVAINHTKLAASYAPMLSFLNIGAIYVNIGNHDPRTRLQRLFGTAEPAPLIGKFDRVQLSENIRERRKQESA